MAGGGSSPGLRPGFYGDQAKAAIIERPDTVAIMTGAKEIGHGFEDPFRFRRRHAGYRSAGEHSEPVFQTVFSFHTRRAIEEPSLADLEAVTFEHGVEYSPTVG